MDFIRVRNPSVRLYKLTEGGNCRGKHSVCGYSGADDIMHGYQWENNTHPVSLSG